MNIKIITKNFNILQKGPKIAMYGEGSTSGKYARINSSLTKLSKNSYRLNISVGASSNQVYNGYGIHVYAHIGGSKIYKGYFTISAGSVSQSSFPHDFSISSNTSCYASCICSYCENGSHSENYDNFYNVTSADTATFEVDLPAAPSWCSASGSYEVGATVNVSWGAVSGATSYNVQYNQWDRVDGWKGWGTAKSGVTGTGLDHVFSSVGENRQCVKYRVEAVNAGGRGSWSPESNDIYHYGVRVNSGGFKWGKVKVWDGGNWQHGIVKCWNGSSWVTAK